MKNTIISLLIFLSLAAHAESVGWVTKDGTPVPNSDSMKSINGFGGWLVVTPDRDWEEKWNTSPDTTPAFSGADEVSYGEELTILPFFINPKTSPAGDIEILCDIKVTRPDGTPSTSAKNVPCATGKFHGDPHNVYLTSAVIKYIGEANDPPGKWVVEITLTDKVRGTAIPLRAYFNLRKKTDDPPSRTK